MSIHRMVFLMGIAGSIVSVSCGNGDSGASRGSGGTGGPGDAQFGGYTAGGAVTTGGAGGEATGGASGGRSPTGGRQASGGAGGQNAGGQTAGGAGGQTAGGAGGQTAGGAGGQTAGGAGGQIGLQRRPNPSCVAPTRPSLMAPTLSETGCFAPDEPRKPLEMLVPYDVASPLWSDGSEKHRYFAIPDGTQLALSHCATPPCIPLDSDHLEFPEGSVLVKTFGFAGRLHETRLLVKFGPDSWKGFSYKWRDDQSDADLLTPPIGGLFEPVRNDQDASQSWHYPDESQCFQCHTDAAGISLGPTLRQLAVPIRSEQEKPEQDQVDALFAAGFIAGVRPDGIEAFARLDADTTPVELKARAYLHSNCAICHRPGGNFEQIDLRFDTRLSDMGVCNQDNDKGNAGVSDALRLVPGAPERSTLTLRMQRLDNDRMPQIGSKKVDEAGLAVVESWIRALTSCP